jgi:hypothetical protein
MTAATRGLPMLRAWHGDHIKRGATVEHQPGGYRGDVLATVLSAQGADVAIRVFTTGERLVVKPHTLGPVQ